MKTLILSSLALCFGAVIACSANDNSGTGDDGLKVCAKSACGPQLGMPNYVCPDGKTVAGPTGECVSTNADPQCHWQVVTCPPPPADCTKEECGPEPMIASQVCPDGGVAGPTCERVNGVCGWHITTCDDSCTPQECGPEPLYAIQCDGGGTAGPICERTPNGCAWQPGTCQ